MSTLNVGTVKTDTIKTSADVEVYTCRAWVNFNGTGTVAIRASGNVSSITDNNTGDYTVNFTNAFADANYSAVFNAGTTSTSAVLFIAPYNFTNTVNATKIVCFNSNFTATQDINYIQAAIFR